MKKCPQCSEDIQDDAKKCRFCGERLTGVVVDIKNKITLQNLSKTWTRVWNIGIVIVLFSIMFVILGSYQSNKVQSERASAKASAEQVCSQMRMVMKGATITIVGKEIAEKEFKENRCTNEDLNTDFKMTEMDQRVINCRGQKRVIDTYDYNQCLKERGF